MEFTLQKKTITINDVVLAETVEQPLECDAMLPDYHPDIAKILKCSVCVHIGSTEHADRALTIEGLALIQVFYLSEGHGIRRCEYKVPFTRLVELPRTPASPVVTVTPSVDYVNCRAISGRRIDVRGSLSLAVKVTERGQEEIISGAEGGGVQLRQQIVKATELSGQSESAFSVAEDLELAYGKPAVGSILRTDLRVNVHDAKVVSGRVVAKADMMVHVTYLPQDDPNKLEMMDYTLPLSQIIDAEGVDEDSICDIMMHPLSFDIQPKADDAGEQRLLALEARVKAVVAAHRHQEVPVASDCYSTEYECSCKQRQVPFLYLEKVLRETIMHRAALELPEGVTEVLDVWCDAETLQWTQEAESLALSMRLTVAMFARVDGPESIMYFEQTTDLEQRFPVIYQSGGKLLFEPSCDVLSCTYGITGKESMDIRCEISIRGRIYSLFRQGAVGEIEIDENAPRQKDPSKLILYFADGQESVWDIAKRYNTSANAIWEENEIKEDLIASRRMLMIPIV